VLVVREPAIFGGHALMQLHNFLAQACGQAALD
jgi:hypothetical protein